jgi:hypothetical protein
VSVGTRLGCGNHTISGASLNLNMIKLTTRPKMVDWLIFTIHEMASYSELAKWHAHNFGNGSWLENVYLSISSKISFSPTFLFFVQRTSFTTKKLNETAERSKYFSTTRLLHLQRSYTLDSLRPFWSLFTMLGSQSAPQRTFRFNLLSILNTTPHITVLILQHFHGSVVVPETLTNFLLKPFSEALPNNIALYQERLRRYSFDKIFFLHEVYPDDLAVYQEFLDRTEGPIVESSRNLNALLQRPDILRPDYEERLADFRDGILYPPMRSASVLTAAQIRFKRWCEANCTTIDNRQDDACPDIDNEAHTSNRQRTDPFFSNTEEQETSFPSEVLNPIDHLGTFLSQASSSNVSSAMTPRSGDEDLGLNEEHDPSPTPLERPLAVAVPNPNTIPMSLIDPALSVPGTSSTPLGHNDLFIGRAQIPENPYKRGLRALELEQQQGTLPPSLGLEIQDAVSMAVPGLPDLNGVPDSNSNVVTEPILTMGIPPPGYRSRSNNRARMAVALSAIMTAGYTEAMTQGPTQSPLINEMMDRGRTAGQSSSTRSRISRPMRPEREDSRDDHPLLPKAPILRPGTWRRSSGYNSSVLDPNPSSVRDLSRQTTVQRRHQRPPSPYPQVEHIEDVEPESIHSETEVTSDDLFDSADNEHLPSKSPSPQPHFEHIEDIALEHDSTPAENRNTAPSNNSGAPDRRTLEFVPIGLPQPPIRILKAAVPDPINPEAIFGALQDFSNRNVDPALGQNLPEQLIAVSEEDETTASTQPPTQPQLLIHTTTQVTQTIGYAVTSPAGPLRASPVEYHDRRGIDEHLHVGNHRWTGDGHFPGPPRNGSSYSVDISYGEVEDIEVQIRELSEHVEDSDLDEYGEFVEILRTTNRRRTETVEQTRARVENRDRWERFVGLNGLRMTPAPSKHSVEEDLSLWRRYLNKVKRFFRRKD